ncbi:hypothetical protein GCM10007863_10260 [Dyella mobilis]|nr:hypothetical protein GCM10007863_10260 [Dyella mobilis]
MAIFCAFLLGFLGAVLIYLASGHQRLLAKPLTKGSGTAGWVAICASTSLWWQASGSAAGLAGSMTTLMLAWVTLPYLAWWRGRQPVSKRIARP